MNDKLYIDDKCVVSFFVGELGWFLQRFQGFMRHLKATNYKEHKFLMMANMSFFPFVRDFVTHMIDLPEEFKKLGLETDCYEAPIPNSPPGSLTPPKVWSGLIEYIRNFYNKEKAEEVWTPRGYDTYVDMRPQTFQRYVYPIIRGVNSQIVSVFPRGRTRSANRNVPEYIWKGLVDILREHFVVMLGGTVGGSYLADYEADNIINLIKYNEPDKTDQILAHLCNSILSISSQSGPTHMALLCNTPSYIIGHEKDRHAIHENRFKTPVSFRTVQDYRTVDVQTIVNDINGFFDVLNDRGIFGSPSSSIRMIRPSLDKLMYDRDLVGAEIGVYAGRNAIDILTKLDIKKLYLIDPYTVYADLEKVGGTSSQSEFDKVKSVAKTRLSQFGDRVEWIEKFSADAINDIPDDLDFVYIDGNHTLKYISGDLELYFPKVKEGGLIAGHDYDKPSTQNNVVEAVDKFFSKLNMPVESAISRDDEKSNDWWVIKRPNTLDIISSDKGLLDSFMGE